MLNIKGNFFGGAKKGFAGKTLLTLAALLTLGTGTAYAGAGQAKPPNKAPLPLSAGDPTCPGAGAGTQNDPAQCPPTVLAPQFSVNQGTIHQFHAVGFIQNATVSNALCLDILNPSQWGGTALVNGINIVIPCNTILQFPAATFTWADTFDPTKVSSTQNPIPSLNLPTPGAPLAVGTFQFPSTEVTIDGNIVDTQHIAGLVFISQQSLNGGAGFITGFDYANGVLFVSSKASNLPEVRLQINDLAGRFTLGQSPDTRFNVDDVNPTIHANSGYPMCIPRTDPAVADDSLCPQRNRPKADANGNGCRTFADVGIVFPNPPGAFFPTPPNAYCTAFVMKDPAVITATDPTPLQQAPLEIGDYIIYSGTLLQGSANGPNGTDTVSVHTITVNAGIFTQPNTLPSYVAVEEFGVGAGGDVVAPFNGVPQELTARFFLSAFTTDVKSIVDVYFVDFDPVTGAETDRWLTPISMTSEAGAIGSNGLLIDGGITTQFAGAAIGRARIRALKPPLGMIVAPTRYMRVTVRKLCDPANINSTAPLVGPDGHDTATIVSCLKRAPAANGLFSGTYMAPQFGFIFPENVVSGDPIVPDNLWTFPFLANGEGPGTGQLKPTPW